MQQHALAHHKKQLTIGESRRAVEAFMDRRATIQRHQMSGFREMTSEHVERGTQFVFAGHEDDLQTMPALLLRQRSQQSAAQRGVTAIGQDN